MKRSIVIILSILLLGLCSVSFFACSNKTVTMTFVSDGEEILSPIQGKVGSKITPPDNPVKENLVFVGWYLNPEFRGKSVKIPSKMPKKDVTYYARFMVGVSATYEVLPDDKDNFDTRVDNAVTALRNLLVINGFTELDVTKDVNENGNTIIKAEIYVDDKLNVEGASNILRQISSSATFEIKAENNADAENLMVGSEHLESVYVTTDSDDNYVIGLKFNSAGTARFAEVTSEYLNKPLYIFIGGEFNTMVIVNSQITNGSAVITSASGYAYWQALEMANRLQAGVFGVKLHLVQLASIKV